jgi:DNA uptake protein ComE-like DNA-binding protein
MRSRKPIKVQGGAIIKVRTGHWLSNPLGSAVLASHSTQKQAERYLERTPSREAKMKVKTKTKASKATTKATSKPAKREGAAVSNDKLRADVAKRLKKESLSDVASALHITAGKAAFLNMINEVENGEVASISTNGNEEAVAKRIIAAREKQDAHSSWGWIAARTGLPEAKVKKLAEEHGLKVKGTHVAKERAAKNGGSKPAKGKTVAKKKGKGKADPSK